MMFPPSKRQRTSTRARSPLSLARLSTTGREQKGRPLAQFIVPGAKPTCLAPPSSSLTRPRCMRRSLRAESDTACDPSSPGPRTAATYTGVAVSKRTAGPSFLVRQRWRHPPGIVLFTWDEFSQGLDMALAQSAVSVGNSVWVQAEGFPIGGPHSPACCSVVLGADEAAWTNDAAARAGHGFMPEGRRLAEQVVLARYVDDLIMVSRVWCSSCLEDMLAVMCRKPVQFDRQATSAHGQPWLDMWVSFRGGALEIHMDGQEQEWVQCQASKPPAKIRLKPYVMGDVAESLDALRLHVSGRIARLRQAGLDDVALHKAVQREILVFALHGYPREMMLRVWSRSRQYPAAAKHARNVLGAWKDALPGLARLKPDWTWATPAEPQWEA